jgi:Holliday junction resolvasome RuvABC ATP-dependent DNA helicase subunit
MIINKIFDKYQELKEVLGLSSYGGGLLAGVFNIEEEKAQTKATISLEERLFSNVIGYSDVKKLLAMALISKEPLHILMTGPPASSKTVFLLEIERNTKQSYFADGTAMSGSGIIDYLFENPNLRILLIDEVDKLDRRSQTVLLNLMETGILVETRAKRGKGQRSQKMNVKVFGSSNESKKMIKPLKSRFIELQLEPYTWEEFKEIAVKLLRQRYGTMADVAEKIANEVWNNLKTKDVRDVLQIGKLATKPETVHFVATTLYKYRPKHTEENNEGESYNYNNS